MKYHKTRNNDSVQPLLNVSDAAAFLGISTRSVRRHIASGDLPHRRVGWLIKFDRDTLDGFAVPFSNEKKGGKQ
ncbi:MAG: helix-turn-helix domain-containing protein [Luteolibacter sp.]